MNNYKIFVITEDKKFVEQKGTFVYFEDVENFCLKFQHHLYDGEMIAIQPIKNETPT